MIALLSFLGGILGLKYWHTVVFKIGTIDLLNPMSVAIVTFVFTVYLLSLMGGILLFKNKRLGYIFVMVSYVCQIPVIITSALNYHITSGAKLWLTFIHMPFLTKIDMHFKLGSKFAFSFYNAFEGYIIGVNVLAIIIVSYLIKNFSIIKTANNYGNESVVKRAYSSREFIK